jgi:hypothetical protein
MQLRIAQQLFCHTAPDGAQFVFATLADGGCAIIRDEEVVEVFAKDADSVHRAVSQFQHLTDFRAHAGERD